MNWPDPGTPPHHGTDELTDADERHDGEPSEHAPIPDPRTGEDGAGTDGLATPTYAQLRSEAEDDLGRWEAPDPPAVQDPAEPVPGIDPAGADRSGSSAVDVGTDAANLPAPRSAPDGPSSHVSSDEYRDAASEVGGATGPVAPAPGTTREDSLSGADVPREGSGFGRPASSPHTGSWEAGSDAPAGPEGGASGEDDDHDAATASGHAEGEPEVAAPRAPGGLASAGARVDPAGASGGAPDVAPDVEPFHGERDHGDGAPRTDDAGMFHGERGGEPRSAPPVAEGARSTSAAAIEDALSELDEGDRHATVICVANQKGGVGKTTTTVSLGAALAMLGAQVLVVDLDPQGNATTGLGLRAQEGAPSTYRVIVEQMDVEDAAEPTAVRGLHVLPSSLDLAGAEIELVPAFSRENRLKQALDAVRDLYDVILIDCPPSLGLLTINALVAADQVLVPIQCEYYALEGLGQLMRTVKLVADSLNRGLGVGGVVLTMFDGRTNLSQQVVDEVQNYFGDIAYQTIVPRTVRLSEAPSYGQPIGVFDASSRGARAYQRLAREVARRLDLELEEEDVSPLDRLLGSSPPAPEEAAPLPTDLVPDDVPAPTDGHERSDGAADEADEHVAEAPPEQHDEQDHDEQDHDEPDHQGWHGDDQHHDGHRDEDQPGQPHGDHGDERHGPHHGDGGHQQHADEHHDHGHDEQGHEHHGDEHHDHGHDQQGREHHGHGHEQQHREHHDEGHHHQHDEPGHGTEGWT